MIVSGTVISVDIDVQVAKTGGGSYPGTRLSYRDEAGVLKEKAFHTNVFKFNPTLKVQLSNLKVGEAFQMTLEKEGEYWNAKSIIPVSSVPKPLDKDLPATGKAVPYAAPKNTYETPEERKIKQRYIIKQSSINNAVAILGTKKTSIVLEEVLVMAKQIEDYIYTTSNEMPDDSNEVYNI